MTSPAIGDFPARAGDALWRALVDSVPYYVALMSPEGQLLYLNHAAGAHSTGEFLGRSVFDLLPQSGPRLRESLAKAVATSTAAEEIEVPVTIDGTTRWFSAVANAIRDASGEPQGILAVGQDVTESRQTAIELRMSVNALNRLIEAREQLAADLHDGILQSLYGIGLRLEAARSALAAGPDAVESHLDRAIRQLNETMKEIRQFIRQERATGSLSVRWEDTLAGVLRGLESSGGPALSIEVRPEVAARVPEPLRNELVFIAREAVSNAMRHSQARRVSVRLIDDGAYLRLEIEDDGRGFPGGTTPEGIGLLTMTRRAGQIGAILKLNTSPGAGTLVRLELPVDGG